MPRLTVEPLVRLAHAVARITSKRDSATAAAIVPDWEPAIIVMSRDAVPAIARRPNVKIMIATISSTRVKPLDDRITGSSAT